jgi:hypothetical protein
MGRIGDHPANLQADRRQKDPDRGKMNSQTCEQNGRISALVRMRAYHKLSAARLIAALLLQGAGMAVAWHGSQEKPSRWDSLM